MRKNYKGMLAIALSAAMAIPAGPVLAAQSGSDTAVEESTEKETKAEKETEEKVEVEEETETEKEVEEETEKETEAEKESETEKETEAEKESETETEAEKETETESETKAEEETEKETEAEKESETEEETKAEKKTANEIKAETETEKETEVEVLAEEKDEVTIPTGILYLNDDGTYTTEDGSSITLECDTHSKSLKRHGIKGKNIYAGVLANYEIDTDKYEIIGVKALINGNYSSGTLLNENSSLPLYFYSDMSTWTYYVVVKEKTEYSISFSAGDVEGVTNLPETITERSNESEVEIILPYYDKNPIREGYGFMGWATEEGGDVVYTQANRITLTADNSNVTLYAVWGETCKADVASAVLYLNTDGSYKVSKTESLTFDCTMGGSGHKIGNHKVSKQELIASMADKFNVDTDKYEILGISTSAPSAKPGIWIKPDETGVASNSFSKTCYLVVKAGVQTAYTVNFNGSADDASGVPETVTKNSIKSEVDIILPTTAPSRSGYTFAGWATEAGGDVEYTAGSDIILDTDATSVTLYAVWEKAEEPVTPVDPDPVKPSNNNGSTRNSSGRTSGGSSGGSGSGSVGSGSTASAGSWRENTDGSWNYVFSGGSLAKGWNTITSAVGTNMYHFDNNGVMDDGWFRDTDAAWYYLEENGSREGAAIGGWLVDPQDGNTYYLDLTTKKMAIGWTQINGTWYYFNNNVDGNTGWKQNDGVWLFANGTSTPLGAMLKNTTTPDGYKVGADGAWIK